MVEKLIQRTMNVITNKNKWEQTKNKSKTDKFDENLFKGSTFLKWL